MLPCVAGFGHSGVHTWGLFLGVKGDDAEIILWMWSYTDTMGMSYHSTALAGWEAPPLFLVVAQGCKRVSGVTQLQQILLGRTEVSWRSLEVLSQTVIRICLLEMWFDSPALKERGKSRKMVLNRDAAGKETRGQVHTEGRSGDRLSTIPAPFPLSCQRVAPRGCWTADPGEAGAGETAVPLLTSFEMFSWAGNRCWSPSLQAEKSYLGLSPAPVNEVDLQPWEEKSRK